MSLKPVKAAFITCLINQWLALALLILQLVQSVFIKTMCQLEVSNCNLYTPTSQGILCAHQTRTSSQNKKDKLNISKILKLVNYL